jgi:polyphosphate glucokinase
MARPLTLAIDIGGTHLKAGILSPDGVMSDGPRHVDTPHRAGPEALIAALDGLIEPLGSYQRISIGFPGVVRDGNVLTAPNLDTAAWHGFPLAKTLAARFKAPARLANDALVQALGVIEGTGLECVITLGTGMGFAVFEHGRPGPHLELSQHPVRGSKTYDQYIGNAAFRSVGRRRWNRRVRKAIGFIATLTNYDVLYIGGGNARNLQFKLPDNVRIVSNDAGITGGIKLWDPKLDATFAGA